MICCEDRITRGGAAGGYVVVNEGVEASTASASNFS